MGVGKKEKKLLRSELSSDGSTLINYYIQIVGGSWFYPRRTYVRDAQGVWVETKESVKSNRRKYADFKRKLLGLQTPEQLTALRKELNYSQNAFSKLFGAGPKSFQKYEAGTIVPSGAVAKLLWLVQQDPKLLAKLAKAP